MTRKCIYCGKVLPLWKERPHKYCVKCAIKRMRACNEQLHAKEGPYYDKWVKGRQKETERYRK